MTTDTTATELGEAENGDGHTDQDYFGDLGLDCNPFDDFSHEDFGGFDDSGDGNAGVQSSGLDFSNLGECPSGPDFELTDTENSIIQYARRSIAGKRGRTATKKSENVYVTHEDFEEGAEQEAFLLIYGYAAVLFNTLQKGEFNEDNKKQQRAIDFFFCRRMPLPVSTLRSAPMSCAFASCTNSGCGNGCYPPCRPPLMICLRGLS
jgi:hypothetical protein